MKYFILVLSFSAFLLPNQVIAQNDEPSNKDYTLAYVGERIQGVYIFFRCEPYQPYTYIATIKASINWTGSVNESFEKVIKKARKKHPYFNGMIFRSSAFDKADLIKFDNLDVTHEGIGLNDYVSFVDGDHVYYGAVVQLKTKFKKAVVKYTNIFGEEKAEDIYNRELTVVPEEIYVIKVEEFQKTIDRYKFEVGDSVRWVYMNELREGEIVTLNEQFHKANVQYINKKGVEKIQGVPYLKLTKIGVEGEK